MARPLIEPIEMKGVRRRVGLDSGTGGYVAPSVTTGSIGFPMFHAGDQSPGHSTERAEE